MSEQNWKAGDVALINGEVCMYLGRHRGWEHGDDRKFAYSEDVVAPRPLAIIDPEDREQVERLWDAIMGRAGIADLMDGLREFANPASPKPEWTDGDVWASDAIVYTRAGGGWFGRGLSTGDAYDGLTDENVDYQVERGSGSVIRKQSEVTP